MKPGAMTAQQIQLFSIALFCFGVFAVLMPGTHTVNEPAVYPSMDLFVPSNMIGNITAYNCSVSTDDTSIIWEIRGRQVSTNKLFMDAVNEGIYIEPWPSDDVSMLLISEQVRQTNKELSIQCVASRTLGARKAPQFYIITYDQPSAMDNLKLVPSDEDLILQWDRPDNVPGEVPVTYQVTVNSTNKNVTSLYFPTINETFVSLQFLQDQFLNDSASGDCIMFEFYVSGSNDAGTGPLTTIVDTIPLSVDIRNVSKTLKVERVNLQPLLVEISFLPVNLCNRNYPLRNYSLRLNDMVAYVLSNEIKSSEKDGKIYLQLNSTILPEVTLDSSYLLSITACNDISCRSSDPANLNTTNVQEVKAIFYKNYLFLHCTFTGDSNALGCALKLTVSGSNDTEVFNISRKDGDTKCFDTNNQFEAYGDIIVFDIEEDGLESNTSLNVVPIEVFIEEVYTEMTRCPASISVGSPQSRTNIKAVVAGVTVSVILLLIPIICLIIFGVKISKAKKRAEREKQDAIDNKRKIDNNESYVLSLSPSPVEEVDSGSRLEADAEPTDTINIRAGEPGVKYNPSTNEIVINKQKLARKLELGVTFEDDTIFIDKQKLAKFLAIQEDKVTVTVKFT